MSEQTKGLSAPFMDAQGRRWFSVNVAANPKLAAAALRIWDAAEGKSRMWMMEHLAVSFPAEHLAQALEAVAAPSKSTKSRHSDKVMSDINS